MVARTARDGIYGKMHITAALQAACSGLKSEMR